MIDVIEWNERGVETPAATAAEDGTPVDRRGVSVYLGRLTPELSDLSPLFPSEREAEIAACHSPSVRQEKRAIWRLLLYALHDQGLSAEIVGLHRAPGGGWRCRRPGPYLSLSHSGGLLAVALFRGPVGVDLELCPHPRLNGRILRHMLSPQERERYPNPSQQRIAALWTAKESLYKQLSVSAEAPIPFSPSALDTREADVATYVWPSAGAVITLAPGAEGVVWHRHPSVAGLSLPCALPPQD